MMGQTTLLHEKYLKETIRQFDGYIVDYQNTLQSLNKTPESWAIILADWPDYKTFVREQLNRCKAMLKEMLTELTYLRQGMTCPHPLDESWVMDAIMNRQQ